MLYLIVCDLDQVLVASPRQRLHLYHFGFALRVVQIVAARVGQIVAQLLVDVLSRFRRFLYIIHAYPAEGNPQ